MHRLYLFLESEYRRQQGVLWNNLSRLTGMLVVANFSLFFLSGEVTMHGYYYPIISVCCLLVVALGLILPTGLMERFWYYCLFLAFELAAIWFLVASLVYWVGSGKMAAMPG